jgi:hypothetical protein
MYLIYNVNKELDVAPLWNPNHLGFIAVGKEFRDQGEDALLLVQNKGAINQAFPRWNSSAMRNGLARYVRGSGTGTYKPHEIRSACGRR